jgi:hypothetical protein
VNPAWAISKLAMICQPSNIRLIINVSPLHFERVGDLSHLLTAVIGVRTLLINRSALRSLLLTSVDCGFGI